MSTPDNAQNISHSLVLPEALTVYEVSDVYDKMQVLQEQSVTLDCALTRTIDGSGIQLLLALDSHCKSRQVRLCLQNVSDELSQVFSLFNCHFYSESTEQ